MASGKVVFLTRHSNYKSAVLGDLFSIEHFWDQFGYDPNAKLLFTSGLFVYLFVLCMLVYWGLREKTIPRLIWVSLFSLYFYYKCAGIFWILHVVIVVVDFHLARWIESAASRGRKKGLLVLSLVLNLGILVAFKYTNYFASLYVELIGGTFSPWDIVLPVGVSFFTFQSLSYTLDVYRGELKALDSMLDYAFFVTFFPQMVAGPIVRAADFLPQIRKPLWVSREDFNRGVFLICSGLFKKAVIADYIGVNFVDRVFEAPEKYTGLENLVGVYGYAIQIYGDFSGYSDMAIGIALLMGFTFNINFDSPYQSLSITEFWRRWHISLSTWLRDYLYIPLGGNRSWSIGTWLIPGLFMAISFAVALNQGFSGQGWWIMLLWVLLVGIFVLPSLLLSDYRNLGTSLNLFTTMLLGGLWHGASNQFLIWGLLHGTALSVERWWKSFFPAGARLSRWRMVFGGIWAFHFVCFCWIFFRAGEMSVVYAVLNQIFTAFHPEVAFDFLEGYAPVVFLMAIGYLLHFLPSSTERWAVKQLSEFPLPVKAALIVLFAALVMQVKSSDVQPFIYFDF